jgi:hypothetical protein
VVRLPGRILPDYLMYRPRLPEQANPVCRKQRVMTVENGEYKLSET